MWARVIEYGGDGVKTLSVPGARDHHEHGRGTGRHHLGLPERRDHARIPESPEAGSDWIALAADADATYDKVIDLDLASVEPLMAKPHSPDNIGTVTELAGTKVDQVMVGSCTNSSYRDLMIVASMLKGRKISPDVSFGVAPGSRQVLEMIARNGALADIISAGRADPRIRLRLLHRQRPGAQDRRGLDPHQQPQLRGPVRHQERQGLSRQPRDRRGRSAHRRYHGPARPRHPLSARSALPSEFWIDDSMILPPSKEPQAVTIYRGPNIGDPPAAEPLPEAIKGVVAIKVGDKITTDHIMPAGSRLKYRSNIPKYAEFVFEGLDAAFSKKALENKKAGVHNIVIAGASYGQGSSREHAAICPMYLGVKAVIAKSFERIHAANLINFGILPLTFANEADYDAIGANDQVEISGIMAALRKGAELALSDRTTGKSVGLKYSLSSRQRDILLAGGMLNYTKMSAK